MAARRTEKSTVNSDAPNRRQTACAQVAAATSRYMPKVNCGPSGNHDRNVNGLPGADNEAREIVVLRWSLYAGGADVANREAAVGRLGQAKSVQDEALWTAER